MSDWADPKVRIEELEAERDAPRAQCEWWRNLVRRNLTCWYGDECPGTGDVDCDACHEGYWETEPWKEKP